MLLSDEEWAAIKMLAAAFAKQKGEDILGALMIAGAWACFEDQNDPIETADRSLVDLSRKLEE